MRPAFTLRIIHSMQLNFCRYNAKKVPLIMDGVIFSIFMLGTEIYVYIQICKFSVPPVRIGLSPLPGVPEVFLQMWYHFQAQDLQLIPRGDDLVEMVARRWEVQ